MRKYTFDACEFEDRFAEEEVEVIVSIPQDSRHPTLAKFANDVVGEGAGRRLQTPVTFSSLSTFQFDRRRLKIVASIEAPDNCAWSCYAIEDDDLWRHYLLDTGNAFVSYRWSSSA
jgi:hypothetical protein